jgi:hypothetical protein
MPMSDCVQHLSRHLIRRNQTISQIRHAIHQHIRSLGNVRFAERRRPITRLRYYILCHVCHLYNRRWKRPGSARRCRSRTAQQLLSHDTMNNPLLRRA